MAAIQNRVNSTAFLGFECDRKGRFFRLRLSAESEQGERTVLRILVSASVVAYLPLMGSHSPFRSVCLDDPALHQQIQSICTTMPL